MSEDTDTGTSWAGFRELWDSQELTSEQTGRSRHVPLALALWVAALVSIAVAWNGAASEATLPDQFPYLLSGGLVGLALTLMGAAVLIAGAIAGRRNP